jgi:hypothetical protein
MDVILVTYTTEGGISKSNYYAYGIKAFDWLFWKIIL